MKLKDLIESNNTGLDAIKRAPIVEYDTGIRCLRIGDISNNRPFNDWGYTEVEDNNYKKFQLKRGDIIVARTGATIGVNKYIDKDYESVYNNGLIRIRVKEENNPRYVYYLLQSNNYKNFIKTISMGTSTQPNMQMNDLLNLEVPEFDRDKQDKIVQLLGSIDKKIELNNGINNNLHNQCIYFFNHIFTKFEDEDILENLCNEITRGYTKNYVEKSNLINLNQKVNKGELLEKQYYKYLSEDQDIPKNRFVKENDILLNSLGQGTLGRVHLFGEKVNNIVVDQHITILRTGSKINPYYLYYLLITPEYQNRIEGSVTGTTGMLMLNISSVRNMKIPVPKQDDLNKFKEIVSPIRKMIAQNNLESEKLSELRDILLPKLMNGEIDLDNIEI